VIIKLIQFGENRPTTREVFLRIAIVLNQLPPNTGRRNSAISSQTPKGGIGLALWVDNLLNIMIKLRKLGIHGLATTRAEPILDRAVLQFNLPFPKCHAIPPEFPSDPAVPPRPEQSRGFGHKHSTLTAFQSLGRFLQ
jgi:hypothetical protein